MSDIITDAHSFEPGTILELFELDLSTGSAGSDYQIFRWHSGNDEHLHEILWQGNRYLPFPIEAEGFEFSGKGSIPRPTLTLANITSLLSNAINQYDDLVGAKVTRKRTFSTYLDSHCDVWGYTLGGTCAGESGAYCSDSNYTTQQTCLAAGETWYGSYSKSDCLDSTKYGSAGTWTTYTDVSCVNNGGIYYDHSATEDPTAEFADEIWYIDRKAIETNTYIQFELTAAHDVQGVKLPSRSVLSNGCPWKYRGTECGYSGTNYFDIDNNSVSDAGDDVCAKTFTACEKRFPNEDDEIPFGGFPGAGVKTGAVR